MTVASVSCLAVCWQRLYNGIVRYQISFDTFLIYCFNLSFVTSLISDPKTTIVLMSKVQSTSSLYVIYPICHVRFFFHRATPIHLSILKRPGRFFRTENLRKPQSQS